MVAASKMRRAVANTLALRPYARLAQALLQNLSEKTGEHALHPLLQKREVKKVLVIVVGTDRGLCGGLNAQLFRELSKYFAAEKSKANPPEISCVAIGRKVQEFLRRSGKKVVAAYGAMSNHPTLKDTYAVSRMVLEEYTGGLYDKVMLVYTDFISAINQKPTVRRLLPLSQAALEEMVSGIETRARAEDIHTSDAAFTEYLFEPSPQIVLGMLLPRLTEMQVYQGVLEATASEHSARMFAMRNATDNASEFIADLTLAYNQLRQASITQELAEISAGRAALG